MLALPPHERIGSGLGLDLHDAETSGSSSTESAQKEAPSTPPQKQLSLDPVAVTAATSGFCDFFPWIKQDEPGSVDPSATVHRDASEKEEAAEEGKTDMNHSAYIAAFQQRDASYLRRDSLLFPAGVEPEKHATNASLGLCPHSEPLREDVASPASQPIDGLPSLSMSPYPDFALNRTSTSSADLYTTANHVTASSAADSYIPTSASSPHLSVSHVSPEPSTSAQVRFKASSLTRASAISSRSPPLSRSPRPLSCSSLLRPGSPDAAEYTSVHGHLDSVLEEGSTTDSQILDIFEDDTLPGYSVRSSCSSTTLAVRVPRQMVGWKAVLSDTSALSSHSSADRRKSKIVGKQGWEVRQEALKNSYDFRRSSGILATMHAGHRLFKHDWHVIVKDGEKYMWRMEKHSLALYREEDDSKVAEFMKAARAQAGRIGSFVFEPKKAGAIFDKTLALASLIAVFGARGGVKNVTAAFEPSTDPLTRVLERKQRETPDREEVMLAMPRPGFSRDTESVMSDTTDEDAGEHVSSSHHGSAKRITCLTPQTQTRSDCDGGIGAAPGGSRARKRFSSFFARGSAANALSEDMDDDAGMRKVGERQRLTDAQRIARQYRTQSMFVGR